MFIVSNEKDSFGSFFCYMGKLRAAKVRPEEQFFTVDDLKLRLSIAAVADKYSTSVRSMIYRAYNDPKLMTTYRAIRASGVYEKGGKGGARHRKVLLLPNAHIYEFLKTVMGELYGPDWLNDDRAMRHELVRPWWTVNKL